MIIPCSSKYILALSIALSCYSSTFLAAEPVQDPGDDGWYGLAPIDVNPKPKYVNFGAPTPVTANGKAFTETPQGWAGPNTQDLGRYLSGPPFSFLVGIIGTIKSCFKHTGCHTQFIRALFNIPYIGSETQDLYLYLRRCTDNHNDYQWQPRNDGQNTVCSICRSDHDKRWQACCGYEHGRESETAGSSPKNCRQGNIGL